MKHLDEGTIHAWLDGGLNAAQSAEVDAHVKSCAECSAKVAEARGLIAASSRILTALDDVPANVTPKKPVAPVRRRRSITPWVSGLAAAVVLVTLWRAGGVEQPAPFREIQIPDIPAVKVPEPSLSDAIKAPPPVVSAPLASAERQAQLPAPSAPQPSAPTLRRIEAPQAQVGRAAGAGARGEDVVRLRRPRESDFAAAAAANPAISIVTRSDSAAVDSRREVAADEARRALRPMPTVPVAGFEEKKDNVSLRLAGCYRLPAEKSVTEAVTTAVGAAASVAKTRARAPAAAPAPTAQVAPREGEAPLALIRLDTTATADGFALRDASTGSVRGVWSPINRDSARVMLSAAGTFTFAIFDKVSCPER